MKDKPELLIDWVYRSTFNKKTRDLELRGQLMSARRCVLSDEMAAFLYTVMVETYSAGYGKRKWAKRVCDRLDDCRHFSRLPHRVTWIEYSLGAMAEREADEKDKLAPEIVEDGHYLGNERSALLTHPRLHNARIGWLLRQHEKIETAVCADYFLGVMHDGRHKGYQGPKKPMHFRPTASIVWQTDGDPLPWETFQSVLLFPEKESQDGWFESEFVAGYRGYERYNVGVHPREMPEHEKQEKGNFSNLFGRARMMWVFLSIFNKVPIIGEHTIVPSRGFIARGSYHRFLEHRVLTINVPEKAGLRKIAREVIAIIRRRAHMVRGHWRDDSRLQKGNKSLWIAEHQRGDASLGFVTHDYAVHHDEA